MPAIVKTILTTVIKIKLKYHFKPIIGNQVPQDYGF